jgi:hypothetical protein
VFFWAVVPNCLTRKSPIRSDIGIVQLDVEGFEEPALKGPQKTIARYRPILILESVPRAFMDSRLFPLGYQQAYVWDLAQNEMSVLGGIAGIAAPVTGTVSRVSATSWLPTRPLTSEAFLIRQWPASSMAHDYRDLAAGLGEPVGEEFASSVLRLTPRRSRSLAGNPARLPVPRWSGRPAR